MTSPFVGWPDALTANLARSSSCNAACDRRREAPGGAVVVLEEQRWLGDLVLDEQRLATGAGEQVHARGREGAGAPRRGRQDALAQRALRVGRRARGDVLGGVERLDEARARLEDRPLADGVRVRAVHV